MISGEHMEVIEIADGGCITYYNEFFSKPVADALYENLEKKVPWKQEKGKYAPFPRLTAWYADEGLTYSYSGVTHTGIPWTKELEVVRYRVSQNSGIQFNSLLLNWYRDGKDSIGFHTDAEPELGKNPVIASVSLGATRQFIMKHIESKEQIIYDLPHGSLLIMGGTSQHHWLHGVPKAKEEVGGRINLTFRKIIK
jgi:alkylated DNA repair dioxygenase AlkB